MNPIKFKEQNVVYAEDQPEYQPLPVYRKGGHQGELVSCWSLSFRERVKVLFSGKVWLAIWTFNRSLQPLKLSVHKEDVI